MITTAELMNIPYPHIVTIFYVMRTPKIYPWKISKIIQYSISNIVTMLSITSLDLFI